MLNRRTFLSSLIASAVLDPEKLLWVPGKKHISIPKPQPVYYSFERYALFIPGRGWVSMENILSNPVDAKLLKLTRTIMPVGVYLAEAF